MCYLLISRGKEFGHDVDFIVTTPELGMEKNLLTDIIDIFKKQVSDLSETKGWKNESFSSLLLLNGVN